MSELENKKRFYEKTWFCILMFILICPVGVFLIWRNKIFNKVVRIMLSVFAIPITFIGLIIWIAVINPKSNIEKSQKSAEIRNEEASKESVSENESKPKSGNETGNTSEDNKKDRNENDKSKNEKTNIEKGDNFIKNI